MTTTVDKTLGIMCVQCIKHSHISFIRMSRQCSFQPMAKCFGVNTPFCKKVQHCLAERIIHNTVHFTSVQQSFSLCPCLTNQNKFRVQAFESISDFENKILINFINHIKAISIHLYFPYPVFQYIQKILLYLLVSCIQFWHASKSKKTFITVCLFPYRKTSNMIPALIL